MHFSVKRKAEIACEALGMNMTTAINLYLVKLGNEMRIPFEVSVDPFYNPVNQSVLEKSIQQLNAGKGKQLENGALEIAQCRTHYDDK